ncbi:MAG: lysylphosphatidylglycerol synthase domain-containing protein, partial [Candidatus Methylomirabilales bacterium]
MSPDSLSPRFRPPSALPAATLAAALLLPLLLCALRWWLLLRAHGFAAPFGRVFFVTYAGAFFNHVLPGSVGGDIAKAVLAASGEER